MSKIVTMVWICMVLVVLVGVGKGEELIPLFKSQFHGTVEDLKERENIEALQEIGRSKFSEGFEYGPDVYVVCTLFAQTSAQAPHRRQRERISSKRRDSGMVPASTLSSRANLPRATSASRKVVR